MIGQQFPNGSRVRVVKKPLCVSECVGLCGTVRGSEADLVTVLLDAAVTVRGVAMGYTTREVTFLDCELLPVGSPQPKEGPT